MRPKLTSVAICAVAAIAVTFAAFHERPRTTPDPRVGDLTPQGVIVPTGRAVPPLGQSADLKNGIVDCVITPDKSKAIMKTSHRVVVISLADGKKLSTSPIGGGGSLTGIDISPDGATIACSNAAGAIQLFGLKKGILSQQGAVQLPDAKVGGPSYPCGLIFLDANRVAVAASRDNSLMVVDVAARKLIQRIAVDTAPYYVKAVDSNQLLVTCWAAPNRPNLPTASASGSDVQVDRRGIAVGGSICRVDLMNGVVSQRARLPLQPTEIVARKDRLFVACANGDVVLSLNPTTLAVTKKIRAGNLSGSAPNSLALDPAGKTLYVAFGGLDRIGAYNLSKNSWKGFMRTEWYPSSVRVIPAGILVATSKGIGSRRSRSTKHGVSDFTSSVSCIPHPSFTAQLPPQTLDGPARPGMPPTPIPARTGEPSLIKHVVYVIKENRTYDQLLGDMTEGNGDPSLTIYGEDVTPNHHQIARQFVLLDNYYCNGILSADGHAWATESNATAYYERSRGGWTRSYPFGDDPLATSSSGYIWDDALDHGRTVRNFGEFDYATLKNPTDSFTVLRRFFRGKRDRFNQKIGVARLRAVSDRGYPGWNLKIPDVLRASVFARRLKEMEKTGNMADLTIVYLPQDHTAGGSPGFPSPRAEVADNDLGLGRVVEALSHSKFWPTSVVFAEEDDPQDGFDHVDGHRSPCLLAGPYVRHGVVISRFYNQASVIRTIERILGLPPMNLNDAEASVMTSCFQQIPDLSPYNAVPNKIPLNEITPKAPNLSFNLNAPDQVDDDKFNHRLWALAGKTTPYPGR